MTITKIEAVTKAKSRIYIDDQPAFVLYKGEVSRYHIKTNDLLEEETYRDIMENVLVKRARARCIYLLQSMDRTEYQLRTKLRQGGYPSGVVEDTVQYVKNLHYIDDVRYAQAYIDTRSKNKSRRQISQELGQKGISREIIQSIYEDREQEDETAKIQSWVQKKKIDLEVADQKERNRLYGFLMRKGFRSDDIRRVLNERES